VLGGTRRALPREQERWTVKRRALVMVAALALVGGACGDDDGDATDDAAATSDGADADAAEDSIDDSDSDESDDGDDGGGTGDSEWCDKARRVEAEDDLLEGVDFNDPEALEDSYQQMIDLVEDAAESAPEEIADDIDLVVDRSKVIFDALRDADFNVLDVEQSVFDDPEADAASERIDAYNEAECGIESDLDDSPDDSSDVTDDTGDTDDADVTDDSDADTDDDVLSGEGTIRDELLRQFGALGMTDEQANCMVDNLDMDEVAATGADDPSMFLDLFETCDIDLTQLQTGG
jgi:hypothetical protein